LEASSFLHPENHSFIKIKVPTSLGLKGRPLLYEAHKNVFLPSSLLKGCPFRKGGRGKNFCRFQNTCDKPSDLDQKEVPKEVGPCHGRRGCRRFHVEPKVETSSVVEPKVEISSVVEPKVETLSVVEPKVERSSVVEPKVETSSVVEPKVERSSVVEPKVERSSVIDTKVETIVVQPQSVQIEDDLEQEIVDHQLEDLVKLRLINSTNEEIEVDDTLLSPLAALQAMGFTDMRANIVALRKHGGRVDRAIDELLNSL